MYQLISIFLLCYAIGTLFEIAQVFVSASWKERLRAVGAICFILGIFPYCKMIKPVMDPVMDFFMPDWWIIFPIAPLIGLVVCLIPYFIIVLAPIMICSWAIRPKVVG